MRQRPSQRRRRLATKLLQFTGGTVVLLAIAGGWLSFQAKQINDELHAALELVPRFTGELVAQDEANAVNTLDQIIEHTSSARRASSDPVWKIASETPILGSNFSAVREVTIAADEIANTSAKPLLNVAEALNWELVSPSNGKFNVAPLEASSPTIVSAATTIELTYQRLKAIEKSNLVPQVSVPLNDAISMLESAREGMNAAANVSKVLPSMMGAAEPREYLVLVQNNAEVRASGGLPGALAVIRTEDGQLEFAGQVSGSAMGKFDPPVEVDVAQTEIYSTRLGAYIGDVNLTPDFPTTAKSAKAMWERRFGGSIDGVVAIDPVVLVHLLKASGPIQLQHSDGGESVPNMPPALTSENVVQTLLSDVYLKLPTNESQDAYFANASQEIFQTIASGEISGPALVSALTNSYDANRLRVWSDHQEEQKVLGTTGLGGTITGPAVGGASFGVFFNDGTGAKMDYYVRRTVQLAEVCTDTGYAQYKVRVTLSNTAPADAATSLTPAVTGDGRFGTPPGSVQTNVVVYGPAQSLVDTATTNGTNVSFGSHVDGARPVGVVTTRLAPGESNEVEFNFVKVVQHADPVVVVTPTVQDVQDVVLPTQFAHCASSE